MRHLIAIMLVFTSVSMDLSKKKDEINLRIIDPVEKAQHVLDESKRLFDAADKTLPAIDTAEDFLEMNTLIASPLHRIQAIQKEFETRMKGGRPQAEAIKKKQSEFIRAIDKVEASLKELEKLLELKPKQSDGVLDRSMRIMNKIRENSN